MSALLTSCIILVLLIGAIGLGALLRRALPKHHLSKDSQDAIRIGVGLVATIAALVLSLLITTAKSSFDAQSGQIKQMIADIILVDNVLAEYGPDALAIRQHMRSAIGAFVDRLWHEKEEGIDRPYVANLAAEKVDQEIRALSPQSELQRSLQARAVQAISDAAQMRLLLFTETGSSIPTPFLVVLVIWLVIIFASFSLFAELNPTVFGFLSLFALSAAAAIYLILELGSPFTGLMKISDSPLRDVLAPLVR
jgi:hypothetical protein